MSDRSAQPSSVKRETLPAIERSSGERQHTDLVVRIARTEDLLSKARAIRRLAFLRVAPRYAPVVARPDPMDYDPHSIVFLAESRSTGLPIASVRIESGRGETFYPTDHYPIPARIDRQASAYVTRLAAQPGRDGHRATTLLIKAAAHYCLAIQLDWMIALAVPPRDRHYRHYGLAPLPELPDLLPMPDDDRKKCRVMACQLFELEQAWRAAAHPMHAVMYARPSPEIEIFDEVRGDWAVRAGAAAASASCPLDDDIGLPIV